jgi:hypothetical protein
MSVSPSFFTVSVHLGTWQVPPEQTPLVQSAGTAQAFPSLHGVQLPPQSTSVSVPFLTVSVQLGAEQVIVAGSHTPLTQSAPMAQPRVSAHGEQLPPQSTSVSEPFATPSLGRHEGVWQRLGEPAQTPLSQSLASVQRVSDGHLVVQPLPQSMPASVPFLTPSLQSGAAH